MTERLVVLLDMDCFYVQVEERHHPHIKGLPAAVVQYNTWKGGGIIAVNYEARAFGVKRGMRGDEARSKCPEIQLVQVPVNRGKADLTRYRDAGKEVINILCDYSDCVERASIDEAYIDFTSAVEEQMAKQSQAKIMSERLKSSWVVGHDKITTDEATVEDKEEIRRKGLEDWLSSVYDGDDDEGDIPLASGHPKWDHHRLAYAAILCEEMRAAVLERTGFKCSAGIAHNKVLGKLSCGLHKPNQQTILPQCKVEELWQSMPLGKIRNLGGKFGDSLIEELGCNTMGDIGALSFQQLMGRYDNKTALWLYNLGKGIDSEPVTSRQLPKSIGCGKNFLGKEILNTQAKVQKWMLSLAEELSERLDLDQNSNKRRAKTLTVSVRMDGDDRYTSMSRSSSLPSYCAERITRVALSLILHTNRAPSKDPSWLPAIKNISLSAGKFEDWTSTGSGNIQEMFKKARQNPKNILVGSNSEKLKVENQNKGVGFDGPLDNQRISTVLPKSIDIEQKKEEMVKNSDGGQKTENGSNAEKVSPKLGSNSFFRNFLQKRENSKAEVNRAGGNIENEPDVQRLEQVTLSSEGSGESDSESDENTNLDVLVSYLSDEEKTLDSLKEVTCIGNGSSEEESNDSIYDAATDIDSSTTPPECERALQLSEDLFAEEENSERVKNSQGCADDAMKLVSSENSHVTKKMSKNDSNCNGNVTPYEVCSKNSDVSFQSKHNISESGESPKVSVDELFPDLDNFDESLLPILPKELREEVERALQIHKTKTLQRKSGLWKYVTSNPSPQKSMCNILKNASYRENDDKQAAGPSRIKTPEKVSISVEVNRSLLNSVTTNSEIVLSDEEYSEIVLSDEEVFNDSNGDIIECDKCGLKISAFEMPEHIDYHVAMDLQTDMRKEAYQCNKREMQRTGVKDNKSSRGKKRGKVNVKASVKDHKVQKLDSFFRL